jgi:hypothetical protein
LGLAGMLLAVGQVASADDAPRYARLCTTNRPEVGAARARLAELDQAIQKAAPDAPIAPLQKQLEELLRSRCFEVAGWLAGPFLQAKTTSALQRWWRDGGREWLARQLEPDGMVAFPPSMRSTLTLEHAPKHRLARLLCRATDPDCGRETAGWVARAEAAFRARATRADDSYSPDLYTRSKPPAADDSQTQPLDLPLWRCANPGKGKRDFTQWVDCVRELRASVAMFPVGAVRAPTSGWLVIRGRRGHYDFCDQLSAYDLATGAYYASKSCSGLALQADGTANAQKTDAARKPTIEAGRVSVDNLREAAWMIFLSDEIEEGHPDVDMFPLPPKLDPKVEVGTLRGMHSGSASLSSSQTTLAWTWVDGGKVVAEGTLTWPDSYRAEKDHAVELLRVVEAGLVPGCPPAPLPDPVFYGCGKGGVSPVDGNARDLCKVQAELSMQLAAFQCKKR